MHIVICWDHEPKHQEKHQWAMDLFIAQSSVNQFKVQFESFIFGNSSLLDAVNIRYNVLKALVIGP